MKLFKAKHVRELNYTYLGNAMLHTVEPLSIAFEETVLEGGGISGTRVL